MNIKNIGIFAHVDAGKTTLTEQLLFHSGAIKRVGRVDHGDTVTDNNDIERERGISIYSMPTSYTYKDVKINIIDTPGHVDFVAEVERSMMVLDAAVLVISAKEGVQSHTKLLFNALKRMSVPTIIFINKIDRLGVDIDKVMLDIGKHLTKSLVPLQETVDTGRSLDVRDLELEVTDDLIELLSEYEESLLEKYLDSENLSIMPSIIKHVHLNNVIPVCYGSALKNIGISSLLDYINDLLPNYQTIETEVSGIVFKIMRKNGPRTACIKLLSGSIEVYNTINEERITNIAKWINGRLVPCGSLEAGEIGLITGTYKLNVCDTFGPVKDKHQLSLGKPTLRAKVIIPRATVRYQLLEALSHMQDADPYLSYELSEYNQDVYINLFGYVQMEILQTELQRKYQLEVTFEKPSTIFMETPIASAEAFIPLGSKHSPFRAGLGLKIEPLDSGKGIEYSSSISYGFLKKTFQNGLWEGIKDCLDQGLHGWELTDMRITLTDYEYDSVTSTPSDYRNLSPLVLFEALKKVDTEILWPIQTFKLTIDPIHIGRAITDLNKMHATIETPVIEDGLCSISGSVPVDTCQRYDLVVHEYTSGDGHFESKLSHYEKANLEEIIERPKFKLDPSNKQMYIMSKSNAI